MDFLLTALSFLGPIIIGKATVPLYGGIKKVSKVFDRLPAPFHQMGALGTAAGLTWLGGTLNIALPTSLTLFDPTSTSALLAGAVAFGIHAGTKTRRDRG
jgi:hypothetical protein